MGLDATTAPGSRGAFDIIVDGRKIFSKHTEHRFPEHGEIIAALKSLG